MHKNTIRAVTASGLTRGVIELRNSLSTLFGYVFFPMLALIVMYLLRGFSIEGSDLSLGLYAIPGIIALNALLSGLMGTASTLMQERDDGTLLRARCLPYGTVSYFIGKLTSQAFLALVAFAIVTMVAIPMLGGVQSDRIGEFLSLLWIVPLGLAAMLPLGAVIGAVLRQPRQLNFVSLAMMVMTAISGVFYPLANLPPVLQWLGQVFPLYWLGRGMRSALLPGGGGLAEPLSSWTLGATALVLLVWTVAGTVGAVVVLRHAARLQAGTRIDRKR